jgi:hypothetical protein
LLAQILTHVKIMNFLQHARQNFTRQSIMSSERRVFETIQFKVELKINPLPSLTLQSARDLNVPCWPKCSKAFLLSYTFKCLHKKTQFFCPCIRALNRSSKGLN